MKTSVSAFFVCASLCAASDGVAPSAPANVQAQSGVDASKVSESPKGQRLGKIERVKYMLLSRAILLEKYDADKDGKLDETEKKRLLEDAEKVHSEFRARFIKRFDKDGDGKLSHEEEEEMKKVIQNERSRRRSGEPGQGQGPGQGPRPEPNHPNNSGDKDKAHPQAAASQEFKDARGPHGLMRQLGKQRYEVRPSVFLLMQSLLLERYDKNRNGRMDEEESALLKKDAEEVYLKMKQDLLARYDKNGDGKLDESEKTIVREQSKAAESDDPAQGLNELEFDDIDRFIRNSFEEELMDMLEAEAAGDTPQP